MQLLIPLCAILLAGSAAAQQERPLRPVHTYSIVAVDSATGEIGAAVQSHWFSVGSIVTWAEPGVGAVATQSFVNPSYGPNGLELMRSGVPAPEALTTLLRADPDSQVRQIGMIDAAGHAAAHTGSRNIPAAGPATRMAHRGMSSRIIELLSVYLRQRGVDLVAPLTMGR